jgi:hypothetical protein
MSAQEQLQRQFNVGVSNLIKAIHPLRAAIGSRSAGFNGGAYETYPSLLFQNSARLRVNRSAHFERWGTKTGGHENIDYELATVKKFVAIS